uniref:Cytochrome P450 n=1 Tax=Leersia perrieri TaxID=77586 RepID=A0A0D9Y1W9_9ORYZ
MALLDDVWNNAILLSVLAVLFLQLLSPAPAAPLPPGPRNLPVIGSSATFSAGSLACVARCTPSIDTIDITEREKERSCSSTPNQQQQDSNNLVDVLLSLQEKGDFGFPITRDTIKAIVLDIFAGGSVTSANTMEWAMSGLLMNPRVMKKVQAEIREAFRGEHTIKEADLQARDLKYLKLVIKETLRLHPPAPLLVPRENIEACEINGYMIPAKARVLVNPWAISRDPRYWEDAEEFKPERFAEDRIDFYGNNYEYTLFGSGRRMCPGYNFGLASMELPLAQLLYSFNWSLPDGATEVDMTEAPGLGVRKKTPLVLCATPYNDTVATICD